MQDMFVLSIIIPHYNTPRLLVRLLDSIPVRENVQVIVVDDNSTVDTGCYEQLCAEYNHVTFLTNTTGKNSPGTCRNTGLQHAGGKWVLFADADDYFTDDFYETVSDYFNSDCDIVYFQFISVELETGAMSNRHMTYMKQIKNYLKDKNERNTVTLRYNSLNPMSKLILRERITEHKIVYDDTLIGEDIMFGTRLAYHCNNITACDTVIYVAIMRKQSLTTTVSEETVMTKLDADIRRYRFLKEKLSRKEFKLLDIAGGTSIVSAVKGRYPIKLIWKMYKQLRANKVHFFRRKWFNPAYAFREFNARSRKYEKDYLTYDDK